MWNKNRKEKQKEHYICILTSHSKLLECRPTTASAQAACQWKKEKQEEIKKKRGGLVWNGSNNGCEKSVAVLNQLQAKEKRSGGGVGVCDNLQLLKCLCFVTSFLTTGLQKVGEGTFPASYCKKKKKRNQKETICRWKVRSLSYWTILCVQGYSNLDVCVCPVCAPGCNSPCRLCVCMKGVLEPCWWRNQQWSEGWGREPLILLWSLHFLFICLCGDTVISWGIAGTAAPQSEQQHIETGRERWWLCYSFTRLWEHFRICVVWGQTVACDLCCKSVGAVNIHNQSHCDSKWVCNRSFKTLAWEQVLVQYFIISTWSNIGNIKKYWWMRGRCSPVVVRPATSVLRCSNQRKHSVCQSIIHQDDFYFLSIYSALHLSTQPDCSMPLNPSPNI